MPIRVALHHVTEYRYDRVVTLGPQVVAAAARAALPHPHRELLAPDRTRKPLPQLAAGSARQLQLARLVFNEATRTFRVTVDLVANMTVINPFEFFVDEYAEHFPFQYDPELAKDLKQHLECLPAGPLFKDYVQSIDVAPRRTTLFLVALNQRVQQDVKYLIRLEPGVQSPEETLKTGSGSCRDSAWLLVQVLRHLGLAAQVRLRIPDSAHGRREVARRPVRPGAGLHRPACLDGGVPARCGLDRPRPDVGAVHRRRTHPAGGHAHPADGGPHLRRCRPV